MASIWHDKRNFADENKFAVAVKSQQTHPRIHSVKKKKVFGELKNVIHNQLGATPLKHGLKESNNFLCPNDGGILNKKAYNLSETENSKLDTEVDLFDLHDFPKSCCTQSCNKSTEELWSENNGGFDNDALLMGMELICGDTQLYFDEGSNSADEAYDDDDEEELVDMLTKSVKIKPFLYLEDFRNADWASGAVEIPKFEDSFEDDLIN